MRGKKGMELSINFIVILILSLVIFAGGIYFTNKFFRLANDYKGEIDKDTEEQIQNLLADGSKVAIPMEKKVVRRGTYAMFALGVNNIQRTTQVFHVNMTFSSAYAANGSEIDPDGYYDVRGYINTHWIFTGLGSHPISPNGHLSLPIMVNVMGNIAPELGTKKGTYVFDVCVCKETVCDVCAPGTPYLYDGYVHKIYVEVP
jgi:hypothetical protein